MPNRRKATPDRTAHIRAYLEKKSKKELVTLLLDLVQGMDEPTRQRFWEHLAPPGMATADLRYPSAEDFLAELEAFAEEVSEGSITTKKPRHITVKTITTTMMNMTPTIMLG